MDQGPGFPADPPGDATARLGALLGLDLGRREWMGMEWHDCCEIQSITIHFHNHLIAPFLIAYV